MTRLVVSVKAQADIDDILEYLATHAGAATAVTYGERFAETIERLVAFPKSGGPRPTLGADARIALVYPYILIYDYTAPTDTVALLRVLHGKRNITEKLITHPKS